MVMSAFRRSVVADTKNKGGGRRGNFYDKYRLPADPAPEAAILFIRGDYLDPNPAPEQIELDPATGRNKDVKNPYFKYRKHRRAWKKNGKDSFADEVCSAGHDPHNPQQCVGCYAMDTGDKSVGVGDSFGFGIVHLAYYHGHPLLDDNNQMVMKKDKPNEPVIIYSECEGRTCNYCRVLQGAPPIPSQTNPWPGYHPSTLSTIFGRRRYLDLGKGHLGDIAGIDQVVSSRCGNCKSQLVTDGFACPYCNSMVIDMAQDPRTDEQIAQEVLRPYPCMRCGRPVMLKEIVSCETCERQNRQGVQNSIFDVVLLAKRQGEGTKSHIVRIDHMSMDEYAQRIDPRFFNGKTFREFVAELAKPYEFDDMFKPRSLQDQSKRLELPMPPGYGGQVAGPQYAAYGAPQQAVYGVPQQQAAQPVYGVPQQQFAPQGVPQQQMGQQFAQQGLPAQQAFQQPPQMAPAPQFAPQPGPGPQPVAPVAQPYFGK